MNTFANGDSVISDRIGFTGSKPVTQHLLDIRVNLDTIEADTILIKTSTAAIDANTDAVEGHLAAIETDTGAMDISLTSIAAEDFATAVNQVLAKAELESIDQNWNLLSVNQLNLGAILAAVLNNATSGRQTTAQTSFDAMVVDLAAIEVKQGTINTSLNSIETDIAALEVLQTTTNGKLDTLETTLTNIESRILKMSSQQYGYNANFLVTGIGGGTQITLKVKVPVGQALHQVAIQVTPDAGSFTLAVEERSTPSGKIHKNIRNSGAFTNRDFLPQPPTGGLQSVFEGQQEWDVKGGHQITFLITNLIVNDDFHVAISSECRENTKPTIDTAASTATFSVTTHEDDVD